MPTLTIDLSDTEYEAAMRLPPAELRHLVLQGANRYTTARNTPNGGVTTEQEDEYEPPTQEDLDAIGRGLADEDAGHYEDGFAMMARLREERREGTGAFAGRGKRG